MEEWKQIIGYEGLYEISNLGRVKSLPRKKIVKKVGFYFTNERILTPPNIKYTHVVLTDSNGLKLTILLHRLLAIHFIPNPENKPHINHIDGNPFNFSLSNLEWCTRSENMLHAHRTGLQKGRRGESNNQHVLKDKDVADIRLKYASGNYTTYKLADEYNVSQGYVSMVINRLKR